MKIKKDQLEQIEKDLQSKCYTKYSGHYKSEDYGYWKSFGNNGSIAYQIAILIYDFTKFQDNDISISFNFVSNDNNGMLDLHINNDLMTFEKFEELCEIFYHSDYKKFTEI